MSRLIRNFGSGFLLWYANNKPWILWLKYRQLFILDESLCCQQMSSWQIMWTTAFGTVCNIVTSTHYHSHCDYPPSGWHSSWPSSVLQVMSATACVHTSSGFHWRFCFALLEYLEIDTEFQNSLQAPILWANSCVMHFFFYIFCLPALPFFCISIKLMILVNQNC
jgi:hypothetical protein